MLDQRICPLLARQFRIGIEIVRGGGRGKEGRGAGAGWGTGAVVVVHNLFVVWYDVESSQRHLPLH